MKKLYFIIFLFFNVLLSNSRKFVIIVPSYNNIKWYKENLDSILQQKYNNFRAIYIDDCSTDGTGEAVAQYLKQNDQKKIFKLIKNKERKKALENLYNAIHSCKPQEIIVTVDGDDFLKDPYVLQYLNKIYSNKNIWLTYGQFEYLSNKEIGFAVPFKRHIIDKNLFRYNGFLTTHLRTFYAWLFQHIKKTDLQINSEFFPMAWDVAMMLPMLEMSGNRHKFISKVLYIYNDQNPISDFRIDVNLQQKLYCDILKKRKYKKLK